MVPVLVQGKRSVIPKVQIAIPSRGNFLKNRCSRLATHSRVYGRHFGSRQQLATEHRFGRHCPTRRTIGAIGRQSSRRAAPHAAQEGLDTGPRNGRNIDSGQERALERHELPTKLTCVASVPADISPTAVAGMLHRKRVPDCTARDRLQPLVPGGGRRLRKRPKSPLNDSTCGRIIGRRRARRHLHAGFDGAPPDHVLPRQHRGRGDVYGQSRETRVRPDRSLRCRHGCPPAGDCAPGRRALRRRRILKHPNAHFSTGHRPTSPKPRAPRARSVHCRQGSRQDSSGPRQNDHRRSLVPRCQVGLAH